MTNTKEMNAVEALNQILELVERYEDKVLDHLLEIDLLHSSFEKRYLLNIDVFHFVVDEHVPQSADLVAFYLTASDGCPYKAEIIFEGSWRLKSFLFMCPGCMQEDPECGVCGGSGWGVL